MTRKMICALVTVFLVLGMASAAVAAPPAEKEPQSKSRMKFSDSTDADWATKHIARMKLQNIIKGYEDGNFKPNASVSEAEALVMVTRWLDKEAAAQALANSDLVIPGVNRMWAWGYVKYAVDNKWISTDDFQPNRAASRLWISKLLSRATYPEAQLATELAAVKSQQLPFSDVASLSSADANFVQLAYAKKWMQGYPDNTFKPEKAVTRAEMATLIDRNTMVPKAFSQSNASGTVVSITATTLKVTKPDNTQVDYALAADVLITERGSSKEITYDKVQPGDKVRILLNTDNKVQILTVED